MNRALECRIRRLEQAAGSGDDDELVEYGLSDESKGLLRDALTGLMAPEEIEAAVNERRLVPRSSLPTLSPEARVQLKQTLLALGGDPDAPEESTTGTSAEKDHSQSQTA